MLRQQLQLRWIVSGLEPDAKEVVAGTKTPTVHPPMPSAELDPLRDAANRGDVGRVRRELARLRTRHPESEALFSELERLTAEYRMSDLRDRLSAIRLSQG